MVKRTNREKNELLVDEALVRHRLHIVVRVRARLEAAKPVLPVLHYRESKADNTGKSLNQTLPWYKKELLSRLDRQKMSKIRNSQHRPNLTARGMCVLSALLRTVPHTRVVVLLRHALRKPLIR